MTTTEYQLIVESLSDRGGFFRSIEGHDTLASLIESAAEYEAGEYAGRVVGAFSLTYNRNGDMVATAPLNIGATVARTLADHPAWKATQRALAQEDHALRSRAL